MKEVTARLGIERIYLAKLVFEPSELLKILEYKWRPKVNMEMTTASQELGDDRFEVKLEIQLSVGIGDQDVFKLEVIQAGIFKLDDTPVTKQILAIECPTVLFPYAREAVDSVVNKATLPPLRLAPVNFREVVKQVMDQNKPVSPRYSKPVVN